MVYKAAQQIQYYIKIVHNHNIYKNDKQTCKSNVYFAIKCK